MPSTADPPPLAPFVVEPILSECRRDVVALALAEGGGSGSSTSAGRSMPSALGDAPTTTATPARLPAPRAYIGLDDGTLLVLRREGGEGEGPGGGASASSAAAAAPADAPAQPAASLLVDAAPPWRVVAAHTHVAQKAIRQMQASVGCDF
jgi:hypothetical protein